MQVQELGYVRVVETTVKTVMLTMESVTSAKMKNICTFKKEFAWTRNTANRRGTSF
jgi:hypothetical protein